MNAKDTRQAIDAASDAFKTWKRTTAKQRHDLLMGWFRLMTEHKTELATLLSKENGKPVTEAINEVAYAASFVEWFAQEARRQYGDIVPSPFSQDHRIEVLRQPVGVCALITPWNFPAAMITRKAAAALAAGCTAVIKPAEDTPFTALALVKLAEQAGIPKGVLNVVTCDRDTVAEVGHELATNKKVHKISLTGSTAVGKEILRLSADTVKRTSMELGGNAPFIVFADADIDSAVQSAIVSKYRHSGQTCVCANRFYIHSNVWEEFATKLVEAVSKLKIGYGCDDTTTIGPMINERALQKVAYLTDGALEKGAKTLIGGRRCTGLNDSIKDGWFFEPTVLDCRDIDKDENNACPIVFEEIFGPIAALYSFSDEDEVLNRANKLNTGLAAYIFTRDIDTVNRVTGQLDIGMVGVNTGSFSCAELPFGGTKESGIGREGSKYGLDEYSYMKAITIAPAQQKKI
eukprot:GHVQ01032310.1.p1 GENE.GHVQ01032310.1~~GHVQ01032310.1.p1  ORF type:complete len:461 (+),score=57.15 GHVQ01032310.1:1433-2815(+)